MPNFSLRTIRHRRQAVGGATGVGDATCLRRQLVVVDAHDDGHVLALGGGGDDDLLAPALRWSANPPLGLSRSVNKPVDSTTTRRRACFHGSLAGSRSLSTLIVLPLTTSLPSLAVDGAVETAVNAVVLQQVGQVLRSARSLTATTSKSCRPLFTMARKTSRPMRPKPLMPTLTAIGSSLLARNIAVWPKASPLSWAKAIGRSLRTIRR